MGTSRAAGCAYRIARHCRLCRRRDRADPQAVCGRSNGTGGVYGGYAGDIQAQRIPRKANRGVLLLGVEGGTVTAIRKPGADITFSAVGEKTAVDMSNGDLAAIIAQG